MKRKAHHRVRSTDACAPTLEGCWAYSPAFNDWNYIIWVEPGTFHVMDEAGTERRHRAPIEIEAVAPVPVPGTTPDNYIERLAYHRAVAGWSY